MQASKEPVSAKRKLQREKVSLEGLYQTLQIGLRDWSMLIAK